MTDDTAADALSDRFPPIADYGFLSDCENSCLVAPNGAVEWLCLPRPDSPSLFGALLDRTAGNFRLGPTSTQVPHHRRYIPGTMVLETTWHTPTGWLLVGHDGDGTGRRGRGARLPAGPGRRRRRRDPAAPGQLHRGPRRGGGQLRARLRVRRPHRHVGVRGRGLRRHDGAFAGGRPGRHRVGLRLGMPVPAATGARPSRRGSRPSSPSRGAATVRPIWTKHRRR